MGLEEIIDLVRANVVTVALAAVAFVALSLLALVVSGRKISRIWRRPVSATELRFRNVFAMMGVKRQEELIAGAARKYRCSRNEAMKHLLDQRDRDARSWR